MVVWALNIWKERRRNVKEGSGMSIVREEIGGCKDQAGVDELLRSLFSAPLDPWFEAGKWREVCG